MFNVSNALAIFAALLLLKHVSNQQDELKGHTDNLKSTLNFGEKVLESDADVWDVLLSVNKRVDELKEVQADEKPAQHARTDFESVSKETLLKKVNELVGVILPCEASQRTALLKVSLRRSAPQIQL